MTSEPSTPPGYSDEKELVLKRLQRIDGQIRGLKRMVEVDRYRINVLKREAATTLKVSVWTPGLVDQWVSAP